MKKCYAFFLLLTISIHVFSQTNKNNFAKQKLTAKSESKRFAPLASGIYTVGAMGAYTSLSDAISAVNAAPLTGPVTLDLIDPSYSTAQLSINPAVTTAANTLTIKPDPTQSSVVITGTSGSSVFKLNGASYLTIDGSNNGTNTKNLTITTSSSGVGTAVIWLACISTTSPPTTFPSTYNTIKNCILTGTSYAGTQMGIFSGGSTISANSTPSASNSYNTFQNNTISKVQNGIYALGYSLDAGTSILNNNLGSSSPGDGFSVSGIAIQNQSGSNLTGNDVQNIVYGGNLALKDGF